jgi:hypothetical protein
LPLMSTSVLLGDRPRRRADSVMLAMSLPKAWAVREGRFCASACSRSGWPVRWSDDESSTWIGDGLFSTFRPAARVPVTITVPEVMGPASGAGASGAAVSAAGGSSAA